MSMRAAESRTLTAGSAFNEPVWATVLLDRRLSQATMIGIKGEGCRPGEQTHAVLLGRRTFVAPPADEGRQLKAGPLSMSHRTLWICPSRGRPLSVAPTPEVGEAGAHRPLEISRAIVAAHACVGAARFPQLHSASSSSITRHETDDEGVISEPEYTLTKPSSGPNHRDHLNPRLRSGRQRWSGAPDDVRNVVIRWLVKEALDGFFLLVKETALDRHWSHRETFWTAFLRQEVIYDAWFVLGSEASRLSLFSGWPRKIQIFGLYFLREYGISLVWSTCTGCPATIPATNG